MSKLTSFQIRKNPFLVLENYDPEIDTIVQRLRELQNQHYLLSNSISFKENELREKESIVNGSKNICKSILQDITIKSVEYSFIFCMLTILLSSLIIYFFKITDKENIELFLFFSIIEFISLFFLFIYLGRANFKKKLNQSIIQERNDTEKENQLSQISNEYFYLCSILLKKSSNNKLNLIKVIQDNFKTDIEPIQKAITQYFQWKYSSDKYRISGDINRDFQQNGIIDTRYIEAIKDIIIKDRHYLDNISLKTNDVNKKHQKTIRFNEKYSEWSDERLEAEWESF